MSNLHPYQTLLAIVGNVFEANAAALFLPNAENREQCQLVASWCPAQNINEGMFVKEGEGYAGFVMRSNSPLSVPSSEFQINNINYYQNEMPALKSFLACPVAGSGVLLIDSLEENAFEEDAQKMLSLFARLIPQIQSVSAMNSFSLQMSTFFYALESMNILREQYTSWKKYLKESLTVLAEASGYEYASFASKPEDSNTYLVECESVPLILENDTPVEFSLQAGMVGWVLKNEESIFNDGHAQNASPLYGKIKNLPEFASTITIAIKIDKVTYASLSLASRNARKITPELRSFVKMAAANIAQVLEKVYLKHQLHTAYKNQS